VLISPLTPRALETEFVTAVKAIVEHAPALMALRVPIATNAPIRGKLVTSVRNAKMVTLVLNAKAVPLVTLRMAMAAQFVHAVMRAPLEKRAPLAHVIASRATSPQSAQCNVDAMLRVLSPTLAIRTQASALARQAGVDLFATLHENASDSDLTMKESAEDMAVVLLRTLALVKQVSKQVTNVHLLRHHALVYVQTIHPHAQAMDSV